MYHARFSGTHYEAGLRWGRALALRGKFIARQPTFAISEERRAFARGCLPAYREYFPEILEEIRGHGSPAGFDDWNAAGRYGAAGELLTGKTLSPADGRGVLADRRLCGYDRRTGADTVWAVLYDTKNGRVFRAEGNPSRRAFAEDDRLFSFAAKKTRRG